ncbi:MAG: hypothetical protein RBT19_14795 [Tenuifilaceae bacterium]|jgi:hypothetical protein|nr:hypothetical protein [Tenuifilaceae bacterium]
MKQKLSAAIMLLVALCAEAQDLTVTIPKTHSTAYKCYPVNINNHFFAPIVI